MIFDNGGHSSAGRAPALHAGGRRFDPAWLHQSFTSEAAVPPLGGGCAQPLRVKIVFFGEKGRITCQKLAKELDAGEFFR